MSQLAPIYERVPSVWVLLGLLLNATGLWLGFEFTMSFVYMVVGWFCCAFGAALFALRWRENDKSKADTRLSPNFVSAGAMPPMSHNEVQEPVPAAPAPATESDDA